MMCGEGAGLNLEQIVPIALAPALQQVSRDREPSRLPLRDHMEVLVQDQLRIAPEIRRMTRQQNAIAPSRCARAQMQPCIPGALYHAHVHDGLPEYLLERESNVCWRLMRTAEHGA